MQTFYAEKIEIYFLFMHFTYILLFILNLKHVFFYVKRPYTNGFTPHG